MISRAARVLIVAMAVPTCLVGCSTPSKTSNATGPAEGTASASASNSASASAGASAGANTSADSTGTIVTQPAEPGPSGEPVAPLSTPGLAGDDPNDDIQLGKKYFRSNNFGLAEKSFRSAAQKHPRDAEAWLGLAACYDRLRRFDLADKAYGQAIQIVGPTVEILNDQGFSYMLRGDYERAHRLLETARAQDPANPYVQANIQLLEDSYHQGKAVQ